MPPVGVFGFGLDFVGAAAGGAEFCATAGAATMPNSAAAIVTAKIRLLMYLLVRWREPMTSVPEHAADGERKPGDSVNNAFPRSAAPPGGLGESYSDVILRLAKS